LGYWRVVTEYAHDNSFEQEIFLRRVKNPLNIYLDCDIESADGADAKYAFVFEDMSKDEFKAAYPGEEAKSITWPAERGNDWLSKDKIRVAEYFNKTNKKDTLVAHPALGEVMLSDVPADIRSSIEEDPSLKKRDVMIPEITWYKIAGDKIIDEKPWPGRYIPIVRVIGEEIDINGKIHRCGHTRNLKDAQRMYNYMSSANVEFIALQTKTPYIAAIEAIEGYEEEWRRANHDNLPYLPYNALREDGTPIEKPARETPPTGAQAYLQAMTVAQQELMMASGQYQEQFGQQSNAQAGVAIQARQRQGDRATYHFIDNLARAVRYTGRVLIDLIPKIYDTARVVRIMGEDGSEDFAQIDPNQQQSFSQKPMGDKILNIYNPGVGRYDVTTEVGPNFETRRQEAFNAMTQIMGQNKELMGIAGDLLFKAADFPMADELAERIHRTINPSILGEGEPPQVKQMGEQMQHMGQMVEQLSQTIQELQAGQQKRELDIKAYDAETKRLQVVASQQPDPIDPAELAAMAAKIASDDIKANMFPAPEQAPQTPAEPPAQPDAPQEPAEPPPPPQYMLDLTEALRGVGDASREMSAAAKEMSKPRKRTIQRDEKGKLAGFIEE
jgi:hypothetical protein